LFLDATERDRLEVLGLDEMNCAIVSTGDNMKNSIVICLHLKELDSKKLSQKQMIPTMQKFCDS
jgi:Trk K+ transport system NAD-binding subunit